MIFIYINNTYLKAYTYLGSENIGQDVPFNMLFLMTMLTSLSVCGETTIYSTAMGNIYMVNCMCSLVNKNTNDIRLRNPTS